MEKDIKNLLIRQPVVAGQFYPKDSRELEEMIRGFLTKAEDDPSVRTPHIRRGRLPRVSGGGMPKILIVPHAGYVYSGQTAAEGFKELKGQDYERVILLGNSHNEYFSGLKLDGNDIWQTPLGEVEIDKQAVTSLAESDKISMGTFMHELEHSLEVEVPFLQRVLGNPPAGEAGFKLIPGLFGSDKNLEDLKEIARALREIIDDKTLVVISTDLSHYPEYEDANEVDRQIIDAILAGDTEKFMQTKTELENADYAGLSTCACAWPAVVVALELAHELEVEAEFLDYTNSGDVLNYGDKNRVVGYTSIVFSAQEIINNKNMLNESEQKAALKLARSTLDKAFDKDMMLDEDYKNYPIFKEKRGVFVTLHKNGQLRGCIGLIETPDIPLSEAISEMALAAAFNDTRFQPLAANEFPFIDIEISVLTVPKKIQSIGEIELGKHGVIVKKGLNSGVFLPQVATETGWSKEQFLSELCSQKARLPQNCYEDPDVEIYIYEAQIFHE